MGRVCSKPGCPQLAEPGKTRCEEHQWREKPKRVEPEQRPRPSAHRRGYGRKWREARAKFLAEHQWCVMCQRAGQEVKATVVDHIVPHKGDWKVFWRRSNWQALCEHHHNSKTARHDRHGARWVR